MESEKGKLAVRKENPTEDVYGSRHMHVSQTYSIGKSSPSCLYFLSQNPYHGKTLLTSHALKCWSCMRPSRHRPRNSSFSFSSPTNYVSVAISNNTMQVSISIS
ncbi:hypothetical protein MLD38_038887 [Melastoma candidum]|uniref:Uncharacterized protein n=1 Tax=Melastoma candidum TaxID=119954 RepID=A0ACB9L1I6_9MYRT|nr:hypothetical protein MLD38_038887 [Melastoma candidum]